MKKPYGYVYCIRNLINNKVYVGASIKPEKRWNFHKGAARYEWNVKNKSVKRFYKDICQYGEDNFIFKILESASTQNALATLERKWIKKLKATHPNFGYNKSLVGHNNSTAQRKERSKLFGTHVSDVTSARISKGMKGKKKTDEHKQKIKKAMYEWRRKRKEYAICKGIKISRCKL